ncbi:hypothetical protein M0R19_04805 [Candidatus Pacearchaeota archaeon]|jgi:hypothetical protein|nr:hypothetical protein [Candidatus Pacearchaeota archaeon]
MVEINPNADFSVPILHPLDPTKIRPREFETNPDLPLVIMISYHCCSRVIKEAIPLLYKGYKVIIVGYYTFQGIVASIMPHLEMYIPYFEVSQLKRILKTLILGQQNKKVILHWHNEPYYLGWYADEVRKEFSSDWNIKVVFDVHDSELIRTGRIVDDEIKAVQCSDAFIHVSNPIKECFDDAYESEKSISLMSAMPQCFYIDEGPIKPYDYITNIGTRGEWHAIEKEYTLSYIFQGSAVHPNSQTAQALPYRDMTSVAKSFQDKHLPLTFYIPDVKEAVEYYKNLDVKYGGFVEYFSLIKEMTKFHFSLAFYPDPGGIICRQIKWGIFNKLFDAVAAGVPSIGNKNSEVGKIIDQYDIGFTLKDINDIRNYAYEEYLEKRSNLMKVRNLLSMENQIGRLIDLYKELIK